MRAEPVGTLVEGGGAPRARRRGVRAELAELRFELAGAVLLAAYVAQAVLGLRFAALAALQTQEAWKLASGALLLWYFARQWYLAYLRVRGAVSRAARNLKRHRLLGTLGPVFLYLHSIDLGRGYTLALGVAFLANLALALFGQAGLAARSRALAAVWVVVHIVLSLGVAALAAYHVLLALYFG